MTPKPILLRGRGTVELYRKGTRWKVTWLSTGSECTSEPCEIRAAVRAFFTSSCDPTSRIENTKTAYTSGRVTGKQENVTVNIMMTVKNDTY